ncbi:MAG: hypothetical protein H6899_04015 [Rhodobacter sp.]|nr:hypothetical protein [Paracoccaceae bacterium]MCC0079115.1 hypothetical protein [Rhodobacter sp.]
MQRRDFFRVSLGALGAAALPGLAEARVSLRSALRDQGVQRVIEGTLESTLLGVGFRGGRYGFDGGGGRPNYGARVAGGPLGADWSGGAFDSPISLSAISQAFIDEIGRTRGFDSMSTQEIDRMMSSAMAFSDGLRASASTNVAPLVVGGVLVSDIAAIATIAGVGVAVIGVAIGMAGLAIGLAALYQSSSSSSCNCAAQGSGSFSVPDYNGDGIPDDPLFPMLPPYATALNRAGLVSGRNAGIEASFAFEEVRGGLGLTVGLRDAQGSTTGRFEII